ncbi:MAG TPA: SIMPL domain-containing protein [Nitrososphaera sp.]
MSDQQKPTKKLVLLAAILAAGLLAVVFAASQLTASATAQTEDDGQMTDTEQTDSMEEQPAVTSQDEVDCETDPSQVHCVEEAELISAPMEEDKSTLSVTGMATTTTQPDNFSVTVGVENNATTAAEAASGNAELVNATIAALTDLGIEEEQMATSSYNLFPVYEEVQPDDEVCIEIFPPPPGCEPSLVITGYRASSSLTVTLDTEGEVDAGTVIDTAIGAGANNVSGVFFFISQEKQQEIRDGLIADAIADARHKADVAAEALEMEVSGIHSVSLEGVQFPIFARGAESLQADTQILPGEQEVASTVSITYFISADTNAGAEDTGGTEAEIEEGIGVESETEAGGQAEESVEAEELEET